ncbi:class II aldolase/adducin family protein [Microbacterium sp.]|uniref:class II aldolase/adducin family protein n=1 Tax=Microbacterium sp. TaxID=51671 RepID=UPI003A9519E0
MTDRDSDAQALAALARNIAGPQREWVILAEGNVSARVDAVTMRVKASGVQMGTADADDMVAVSIVELLRLIDDPRAGDADVARFFDRVQAAAGRRPSVEALLHAVCLDRAGIEIVGHAHPTAILALLCSSDAGLLARGSLFPDQIVVLGSEPMFVPYVDPGLELARTVRRLLSARRDTPRIMYLQNHGVFALGATADEVVQIIEMAVKCASVVLGALSAGGPRFLEPTDVARIDERPDEIFRREALAVARPRASWEQSG